MQLNYLKPLDKTHGIRSETLGIIGKLSKFFGLHILAVSRNDHKR